MKTRRFVMEDLPVLNEWLSGWKHPSVEAVHVPPLGFICEGLACGFIVQTDSNRIYLEGFTTNPSLPSIERDRGLREVIVAMTAEREKWRGGRVIVITSDAGIMRRAKELGLTQASVAAVFVGGI